MDNITPLASKRKPDLEQRYKDTKKPPIEIAMGHALPLASMIRNDETIEVCLLNGKTMIGKVQAFDKWTITIRGITILTPSSDGSEDKAFIPGPITIFKHAVEFFCKQSATGGWR